MNTFGPLAAKVMGFVELIDCWFSSAETKLVVGSAHHFT